MNPDLKKCPCLAEGRSWYSSSHSSGLLLQACIRYCSFSGLGMLQFAGDIIKDPILVKMRSGLLESKRDICLYALFSKGKNPLKVAYPGFLSRFTTHNHFTDFAIQPGTYIHMLQKRFQHYILVSDGKRPKYRQALICPGLIFTSYTHAYVFITICPIIGQVYRKPMNPLGDEKKVTITALFYHLPCFSSPVIAYIQKKIRSKACPKESTCRMPVFSIFFSTDGQIKAYVLLNNSGIPAILCIRPIHIAVLAALGKLAASMPWVPHPSFRGGLILFYI